MVGVLLSSLTSMTISLTSAIGKPRSSSITANAATNAEGLSNLPLSGQYSILNTRMPFAQPRCTVVPVATHLHGGINTCPPVQAKGARGGEGKF